MSIYFHSLLSKPSFPKKTKIKKWLKKIINSYDKLSGEINIILISNEEMLGINKKYLGKDYYTDIICFNYNEGDIISGDLYISEEMIMINSLEFNETYERELLRVIVHGIFHLLGFDDGTRKQKLNMRNLENNALDLFYEDEIN